MNTTLTKEEILRLLGKYSIALIIFQIISRFGLNFGIQTFYDLFPIDPVDIIKTHESYFELVTGSISLLIDLIYAIYLLTDMDRKIKLTWAIFALTIFNPWTGTAFFIIMKLVDSKNNTQQ